MKSAAAAAVAGPPVAKSAASPTACCRPHRRLRRRLSANASAEASNVVLASTAVFMNRVPRRIDPAPSIRDPPANVSPFGVLGQRPAKRLAGTLRAADNRRTFSGIRSHDRHRHRRRKTHRHRLVPGPVQWRARADPGRGGHRFGVATGRHSGRRCVRGDHGLRAAGQPGPGRRRARRRSRRAFPPPPVPPPSTRSAARA